MSRPRTDCEGFHRRDVLRLGAAGLLGFSLADALRAAGRSGRISGRQEACYRRDPDLARGRAGDDRYVGHEARRSRGDPRRVSPDCYSGAGHRYLGAHAGAREGHEPLRTDPIARPHDQRPRPGHDVYGHRKPAGAGARISFGGFARRESAAAAPGRAPVCDIRGAQGRRRPGPGYLGPAFGPFEIEGDPVRGTLQSHGVSLPEGFSLRDLESREVLRDRFDRGLQALEKSEQSAGLDGFHRQAVEILHSDRVRAALDLSREPNSLRDEYGQHSLGQGRWPRGG